MQCEAFNQRVEQWSRLRRIEQVRTIRAEHGRQRAGYLDGLTVGIGGLSGQFPASAVSLEPSWLKRSSPR